MFFWSMVACFGAFFVAILVEVLLGYWRSRKEKGDIQGEPVDTDNLIQKGNAVRHSRQGSSENHKQQRDSKTHVPKEEIGHEVR